MTKELEPCPFCGSNASIRTDILMFSGLVKAIVECDGCDVYIVGYGKTKDEAIQKASELWNTRYKRTCKWKAVCDERFWDTECGMTYECYDAAEPPKHCCECGGAVVLVGGAEVVDD